MHEDADELSGAAEFLRELYDAIRGMAESFTARPAISGNPSVIAVAEAAATLLLCFVIARLLAAAVSSLFSRWQWNKLYQTVRARAGDPWGIADGCRSLGERIDAHIGRKDYSLRIGSLVYLVAGALGVNETDAALYFYAAQVCDAGFLDIQPDLLSSEVISGKEKKLLKTHVIRGLGYYDFVPEACLREFLPLVMSHHENMDGSGSPEGLAGEQIPLGARIVHVVESYVSLVSSRGYHHALGRRRAIGELRHQGRLYDQQVVEALASVLAGGIRTAT